MYLTLLYNYLKTNIYIITNVLVLIIIIIIIVKIIKLHTLSNCLSYTINNIIYIGHIQGEFI